MLSGGIWRLLSRGGARLSTCRWRCGSGGLRSRRGGECDEHHLLLLTAACEANDRAAEARRVIDEEGLLVEGRFGKKTHPAVMIERDSRLAFSRLVRQLRLDEMSAATSGVRRR